jgi:uncharacterized membrane protein YccC
MVATYLRPNLFLFTGAVFLIGMFCASLRADRNAYRYAGITLAIVMLAPHGEAPWVIAVHRFAEVSVGIAVGLALSALWPERHPKQVFSSTPRKSR